MIKNITSSLLLQISPSDNKHLNVILISMFIILINIIYLRIGLRLSLLLTATLFISFLIIKTPQNGLMFLYFSIYFLPGFNTLLSLDINEDFVLWGLTIILMLVFLTYYLNRGIILNEIDRLIFLYFIFMLASALIGENSTWVSCKTILAYIQFPFVFLFINHLEMSKEFPHKLFKWILFAIYVQIPVVIFQRIILKGKYLSGDLFTGTLGPGATGLLAVLMSFGFAIIFARILFKNRVLRNSLILLLLTIPVIIGSGRFGHVLFFIISVSFIGIYSKTSKVISVSRMVIGFLIIGIIFSSVYASIKYIMPVVSAREAKALELLLSPSNMLAYGTIKRKGYWGRITRITFSYQYIKRDIKTFLFGYGPGSLSHSRTFDQQSKVSKMFISKIGSSVGMSAIMLDLGIIGAIIYFYLLFAIFVRYFRFYKLTDDPYFKCLIFGFFGIIISTAVSMVYVRPYFAPILAFIFWALAGLIERAIRTNTTFGTL